MKLKKLKAILSDIDGTLYYRDKPIEGAIKTVSSLKKKGIKMLFFTNTDSKTPHSVWLKLHEFGFEIKEDEIYSPIIALKSFFKTKKASTVFLVTTREIQAEFKYLKIVEKGSTPDYVIIGDFQDNWNLNRINKAFRYVLRGAKLLGTQGNKYYLNKDGDPVIDTGSFVQMVSYAADAKPLIFGKPSQDFFFQALNLIGMEKDQTIVVGDDIESDIQGAMNSGIKAILVKTGKGKYYNKNKNSIQPDAVINSFSSIVDLLE